jgi:hypothetical protein
MENIYTVPIYFSNQEYSIINFVIDLLLQLIKFWFYFVAVLVPFGDGSLSIGFHRSVQLKLYLFFHSLMFVYYSVLNISHLNFSKVYHQNSSCTRRWFSELLTIL